MADEASRDEPPNMWLNGKPIGSVKSIKLQMLQKSDAFDQVKRYMWAGMLTQEFGCTDPRIFHEGP